MELRNESDSDLLEQGYLLSLKQQKSQNLHLFGVSWGVEKNFLLPQNTTNSIKEE